MRGHRHANVWTDGEEWFASLFIDGAWNGNHWLYVDNLDDDPLPVRERAAMAEARRTLRTDAECIVPRTEGEAFEGLGHRAH